MKKFFALLFVLVSFSLVQAKSYLVQNSSELEEVTVGLLPGDTVLLAAKTWTDQHLDFKGTGTEAAPIVFGAEAPGQVILSGDSRIRIYGSYLVVRDLVFMNGNLISDGHVIEFRKDSQNLANYCRLTNVTISNYNPTSNTTDTKYLSLYGTHNRVDHCSFEGKNNSGATLVVWLDETPDYHLIDHNYFGPRPDLGVNGGETIRIGTSDWERYESNCTVEYNLFQECDGEIEIISNKSVGNHYRYNTFDRCEGTLTLRHGSDCWVYGNFFFGDPDKDCGGIRLIGPGHRVFNNYLEGLNGTSYRAAICLANGVPNSPANRYRQVEDARVAYNTIIDCKEPFAIGAGKDSEKSLAPASSYIENNLIIARSGRELVKDYDSAEGVSWKGNYHNAESVGISADGFIKAVLPMETADGLQRPAASSPVVGAALSGVFDTLSMDIDGQARPARAKDVGCDQLSSEPIRIHPLSKEEVGAQYTVTAVSSMQKFSSPYRIWMRDNQLSIHFEKEGKRIVSFYSQSGKLLASEQVNEPLFTRSVTDLPRFFLVDIRSGQTRFVQKVVR